MALTPKRLTSAPITNAGDTYYTAPAAAKTRIDACSIVNYSGSAATFSMWLVPFAAIATDENIIVKDRSIAAGASGRVLEAIGQWIEGGGMIVVDASANNALTLTASGIEQTSL